MNELILNTKRRIHRALMFKRPLFVSFSSGKDSSCVLALTLMCAREIKERMPDFKLAPIFVITSNTMIENPEIFNGLINDINDIQSYADKHNIHVESHLTQPLLNDTFSVSIIGGRKLPRFPGDSQDCTDAWKIKPLAKLRNRLTKAYADIGEPITLVGTRFSESRERNDKMTLRQENAEEPWLNKDKKWYQSPIADWSEDNVWSFLGDCRSGKIEAYSNFNNTFRLYADASGTSCAVVADMMFGQRTNNGGCGNRFGCAICTVNTLDKSLTQMIKTDPRYHYMQGLNNLHTFLMNSRFDMDRRSWVGRTIDDDGYIAIGPDRYNPKMLDELLCYSMTLDANELEESMALGLESPRFQLVNLEQLIAIDAIWSRDGLHKPFHALKRFDEIYNKGKRYSIPNITPFQRVTIPAARRLYVGENFDQGVNFEDSGFNLPLLDVFASDGCMQHTTSKKGNTVIDYESEGSLTVDIEGASLVLELELDKLLEKHNDASASVTDGYMYYITMGVLQLKNGMHDIVDMQLRRTHFLQRNNLLGNVNVDELLKRSEPGVEQDGQIQLTL